MSFLIQGSGGVVWDSDPTWRAMHTSIRPFDFSNNLNGSYRIAMSGNLFGLGINANSNLFSCRWNSPDYNMVLTYFKAYYMPSQVFIAAGAAVVQELGLNAFVARSYTATDTGGNTATFSPHVNSLAANMGSSKMGDMRIAGSGVVVAGVRSLDANPFATYSTISHFLNPAAGTAEVNVPCGLQATPPGILWESKMSRGEYPIVLASGEGLVVQNVIAFPAQSGIARLAVEMAWTELPLASF